MHFDNKIRASVTWSAGGGGGGGGGETLVAAAATCRAHVATTARARHKQTLRGAVMDKVMGEEGGAEEGGEGRGKRGLSGSMSLRTRKLGRRLSRSMSIVALKLPEKAQSLQRSSSRLMRQASRDKKPRAFHLAVILPDKTQRQVSVSGSATVAEVVSEPLRAAGLAAAGAPSGPLSAPRAVPLGAPLPAPDALAVTPAPAVALLFLGDSKAPVDPRAPASCLEGEVLVTELQPPTWDGKDLETFIAWEKIYASTLLSAVELYGRPLLRAGALLPEEFTLLFHALATVAAASAALTERMRKYIDSGLLLTGDHVPGDEREGRATASEDKERSILTELVQEGVLNQRDIEENSIITASDLNEQENSADHDENQSVSSTSISLRKQVDINIDCSESIADSSIIESVGNVTTVTIKSGQCCADHRASQHVSENVWANVRWDFLNPADFGYDQVRSVKRSRSESAITPAPRRRNEDVYETLRDIEKESCGSITPYESIEDLYDCIKNAQFGGAGESSPSSAGAEPAFPDYYQAGSARHSSACSDNSGASSAFPLSKCGSSDVTGAFASCESTSGGGSLAGAAGGAGDSESAVLLRQLFTGELLDAYGEFLAAYPAARALLRRKTRRDDHFAALADIRRGAARHSIQDYLQLPPCSRTLSKQPLEPTSQHPVSKGITTTSMQRTRRPGHTLDPHQQLGTAPLHFGRSASRAILSWSTQHSATMLHCRLIPTHRGHRHCSITPTHWGLLTALTVPTHCGLRGTGWQSRLSAALKTIALRSRWGSDVADS
ncbi:unnamed protein product [Plutella xylostella]|uniref:(diamondback moth) hypothetical protein n=1 Tax=Plutella xylostella TaxID=51655 RepID=A0A8S4E7W0_PLUXY|nr:unnamed protein product [Plutella xylostella]